MIEITYPHSKSGIYPPFQKSEGRRANGNGFTLVELSLVMVIIGLIVGAILVGQDLIAAARVRAQVSQIEQLKTTINNFKLKYNYLPGDMPGKDSVTGNTDQSSTAWQYGFNTRSWWTVGCGNGGGCGDGDGYINGNNGWQSGSQADEGHLFWLDLTQSGMFSGNFTLYANTTTTNVANFLPKANLDDGLYILVYSGGVVGPSYNDGKNYINVSKVTSFASNNQGYTRSKNGVKVVYAYNIDTKMDDGLPQSGKVLAFGNSYQGHTAWAGGDNAGSGDYWGAGRRNLADNSASTAANVGDSTSCYNNGGVAGPQKYAINTNINSPNCSLSFDF